MRRLLPLGMVGLLLSGVLGCGSESGTGASVEPGDPVATVGGVRFSLPTAHRVVVERRGADGWGDARVVFEFSRMATVLQRTIPVLLERLGAGRLVFGTGMPLKIPGPAVLKLQLLEAPAEVKAQLAGGNMSRLLSV